ncbi:MAG TPA: serine hydrolase domain-containing protein [Rhodanobacteraceae bacterium]
MIRHRAFPLLAGLVALALTAPAALAADLPTNLQTDINQIATKALAQSGVPSVSIAVVDHGQLAYIHAYGHGRLDPKTSANTAMRYSIGSVSKQFTAAALLLLQQQGKLKLSDPVSDYFPGLTDAGKITLRQILSHTSGYQDYWPQDYVMPEMLTNTTPQFIMDKWAKKPLDFAPGTKWQYSNTNYTIAGAIIEKLTGQTPFQYLRQHVFLPLGITDAFDNNLHALPPDDARGYHRYALGPLHPAPKEGVNWLYGMAELSLTPTDLASWDMAMIHQTLLKPASWQTMETDVMLKNGLASGYGLGVFVGRFQGHRMISHDGEVSGFTDTNLVFPDDGVAVIAMTNQDAIGTSGVIARRIAAAVLKANEPVSATALEQAKNIFAGLQHGKIDRKLFSPDANAYFDKTALHDYRKSLKHLGKPDAFTAVAQRLRGGMTMRAYRARFDKQTLSITTYTLPDGKLEQYIVAPTD